VLNNIWSNFSDTLLTLEEDIQSLIAGPLTFSNNHGFELTLCLVHFPLTRNYRDDLVHIDAVSIWDGSSWREFDMPNNLFLSSAVANCPLQSGTDLYHCLPTFNQYTIFFFHQLPSGALDSRSLAWAQRNNSRLHRHCPIQCSNSISSEAVQIGPHQWIYALNSLNGKVSANCPTVSEQTTTLPQNGVLTFQSSCDYSFVNGPFSISMLPFTSDFTIIILPPPNDFAVVPSPVRPVLDHVTSHYLIYISVFSTVSALLFIFLLCILCYFRCRSLTSARRRAPPSSSPNCRYLYERPVHASHPSTVPLALDSECTKDLFGMHNIECCTIYTKAPASIFLMFLSPSLYYVSMSVN
jgi:hypothetical protein